MAGRPRTVSDDEILDGAVAVLSRLGPQGLTLDAVAEAVGLRAPTLIQRFGSKRDLLVALSDRSVSQVPALFAAARTRHRSDVAAILAALRALVKGIDSPAAMGHHVAFLAMDLTDPDLRRLAAAQAGLLTGQIESGLRRAIASGELSAPEPLPALARVVATAYNGSLIGWAVDGTGSLGRWITTDVRAVLAPFIKGSRVHARNQR